MDLKISFILCALTATLCFCLGSSIEYNKKLKTDLPEEYKLITKDTPIRGYMNKDSVLVIEFVHK